MGIKLMSSFFFPSLLLSLLVCLLLTHCSCREWFASYHTQWHTHSHTHTLSVGAPWTSDRPFAEISSWQHTTLTTDIHVPGGIRTRNSSKRAAADRHLRPRGHRHRQLQSRTKMSVQLSCTVRADAIRLFWEHAEGCNRVSCARTMLAA